MLRIHKKVREVNEIKYGELMAKLKRAKKKIYSKLCFLPRLGIGIRKVEKSYSLSKDIIQPIEIFLYIFTTLSRE